MQATMHQFSNGLFEMSPKVHKGTTEGKEPKSGPGSDDTFVISRSPISWYHQTYPEFMLSETKIKMSESPTKHFGRVQILNQADSTTVPSKLPYSRNITEKSDKSARSSASNCIATAVMQDTCNNNVDKSNKTSIQAIKTNDTNDPAKYSSLQRNCDHDTRSNLYYQRKTHCATNSFRKTTNLPYKTCYSNSRRFGNQIVTISNCYLFELPSVFNYLVVIFIMCQLFNLGIISCVSCFESHSTVSHKSSKYQLPPYAPPSSNFYNSRRFPSHARSDATFQEKNTHGPHSSGPNTLPLYEPHYSNVSHFSEDSKMFTVFNLNGWGLGWPFGSDETERFKLLREYLRKSDYDFVLLQEVWYLSQYELVKGTLPYITDYQALNDGGCSGKFFVPIGCSGLVILSRHPIQFAEVQPFSVRGNFWNFDGEIFVGKGIARVRVHLWNKFTVDLFTTHLVSYTNNPNRDNTWYRFLQSAQTAHAIKTSNADIKIFGGDINARPYLESDRQPYRMLRSVMVDSLLDSHSEEARFDPWFATFAHPTNTYGNGAIPERIDYLMYRCTPDVQMRTYNFKMPLLMGKDSSGRPMSVSDHEGLHAEFIVEMRAQKQKASVSSYINNAPRYTKKRTYPTDRSGLSYNDLLALKNEKNLTLQPDYSDYEGNKTALFEHRHNRTSEHTSEGPNHVNVPKLHHKVDRHQRNNNEHKRTKVTVNKENIQVVNFDKYQQVLYLLNLTSDLHAEDFESNRLKSIVDSNDDPHY